MSIAEFKNDLEEAQTIVKAFLFPSKWAPVDDVLTKLVKDVVVYAYGTFATALMVKARMNHAADSDRTRKAWRKAVVDIAKTAVNVDPMILKSPTFLREISKRVSASQSWDFQVSVFSIFPFQHQQSC